MDRQKSLKKRSEIAINWLATGLPVLFVVNYEAVWREPLRSVWFKPGLHGCVLDESHRIKAPGGKASWFFARLGPLVPHRLLLTGTPMPHSPLDIYAQYRFLAPEIFGKSFILFRGRYAVMGGFNTKQIVSYQNLEELHRKVYSIAFRIKAEDCFDLPGELDQTIPFIMPAKTRTVYEQLKEEFIAFLDQT